MEMNANPIVNETSSYLFKSLACLKTRDQFSELQKLLAFQTVHTSEGQYLFYRLLWNIAPNLNIHVHLVFITKNDLKYSCSLCIKYPARTVTARGEKY